MGEGIKIIASLVVLAIIVAVIALLMLSVSVTDVSAIYDMPFTARYSVTFPEGQPIAIGNSRMSVLSYQNELISDIDGDRQKLVVGEYRLISERRAVITTLRVIKLLDTNFEISLNYKRNRDNLAYFDTAVHTTQQVPDMLLNLHAFCRDPCTTPGAAEWVLPAEPRERKHLPDPIVRAENIGTQAVHAPSKKQFVVYNDGKMYNYSSVHSSGVLIDKMSGTYYDYPIGQGGTMGHIQPCESNREDGYLISEIPASFSPGTTCGITNPYYQNHAAGNLGC